MPDDDGDDGMQQGMSSSRLGIKRLFLRCILLLASPALSAGRIL